MRSVLRRSILNLTFVGAVWAVFGGRHASAQTGGITGTSTAVTATPLSASDFPIVFESYDSNQKTWVQMNSTQQEYFFNRARCECNGDQTDYTGFVKVAIVPPTTTSSKISALLTAHSFSLGIGKLYAGTSTYNCLSPSSTYSLQSYCTNLVDPGNYNASFSLSVFTAARLYESPPIPVSLLFGAASNPTCGSNGTCSDISICDSPQVSTVLYVWAQTSAGTTPDFTDAATSGTLNIVGATSIQPTSVTVGGGNEALKVSWTWPTGYSPSNDANFLGVQVFCQRGADYQVFKDGSFRNTYMTAKTTCESFAPTTLSYGAFSNLDPKYLCSGLISSTSSQRIEGLQNGITYGVGVAVVDKYYNVSPIDPSTVVYGTPIPTVDFYTEYREQGGSAQGGFCALAGPKVRPGVVALILIAGLAIVLRRRRRAKRRPPKAGLFLLIVGAGLLAGRQAHAQPIYHDSSFAEDHPDESWGGSPRQYAIEARFGLYTPNVDSEFRKTTPNADVFGTKRRPMWQIEFDWEFLQEFGTLSLGGVIGYYKENAQACTRAGLQPDGTCPTPDPTDPAAATKGRSGDNTSLRLIPLAALLVYRMDEAANRWKIPLVPYAKIGLNYTIWTVTNGNGDIAWSGNNKGQGGTMGWQAAVGLSLSLDFLDPGAARGFDADSGVNHTYAFFELDHISGSGLYRKDVLRVGDDTWFAGLMFEF
jgi:hypothetical protein